MVSAIGVTLPCLPVNDFGHDERLRQELLDAPGAMDHLLVLLAQFVDAEDRDDVLQFAITLQNRAARGGHT